MRKVEGLEIEFKGQKKDALVGYTERDMLLMLPRDGYTDQEWREAALENFGTTRSTYYKYRKALSDQDKIFRNSDKKYIKL
jgi:hypothetical protein